MSVKPVDPQSVALAAELLDKGLLVAFPTETVYGLGADAANDLAVASVFEAKGRPQFNPLIAHIADISWVERFAVLTDSARVLAEKFWPGPLTMVMKRPPVCPVSHLVCAGLDTIGVRFPAHPAARQMIAAFGRPVAAPSANISGTVSPTTALHVAQGLGNRIPLILDGGACAVGVESTILDVSEDNPALLRAGGVSVEEIEAVLGISLRRPEINPDAPRSPGQMLSHYAPRLPVRLNADHAEDGEAFLAFGKAENATLNLSPSGDVKEAAAHLFAYMRLLDDPRYTGIAVMPIPTNGLGLAINDRLKRAAYPH
ncbi:MAG: L-threonylcarbamoyladenylate synthase [Alphaproteobacteria bacterium]